MGQFVDFRQLPDNGGNTGRIFQNVSLKYNSFIIAWHLKVKENAIFRETLHSSSYIRLCWRDQYFWIIHQSHSNSKKENNLFLRILIYIKQKVIGVSR